MCGTLSCPLRFRKAITTLAFSPDGKYVVTGEVSPVLVYLSQLWFWSRWISLPMLTSIIGLIIK